MEKKCQNSFYYCIQPRLMICIVTIGASLVAQLVKNLPAMQETLVQFLSGKDLLEKDRLPTPIFLGFPGGSAGKEVNSYSLQYSSLENSRLYLDIPGIPGYTVHGVAKSWTWLSNFRFHFIVTMNEIIYPFIKIRTNVMYLNINTTLII